MDPKFRWEICRPLEAKAGASGEVSLKLINAKQSSTWPRIYRGNWLKAEQALNKDKNKFSHTKGGRVNWWMASFEGVQTVSKVTIVNR